MTDTPVAVIIGIGSASGTPTVDIHCPYCGRTHTHTEPDRRDNGVRVAHCHRGDYVIAGYSAAEPLSVECPRCYAPPGYRCAITRLCGYHQTRADKSRRAKREARS